MFFTAYIARLPKNTPARQALTEFDRTTKRPVGRPKPTWVAQVIKEIKTISPVSALLDLETLANDRKACHTWVACTMAK